MLPVLNLPFVEVKRVCHRVLVGDLDRVPGRDREVHRREHEVLNGDVEVLVFMGRSEGAGRRAREDS